MAKLNEYADKYPSINTRLFGAENSSEIPGNNYSIADLDRYMNQTFRTDVPNTATSPGVAGSYAVDENYAYFCYETDLWKRVAIAAW